MANSSGTPGIQQSIRRFLSTRSINAKIIVGFTLPVALMVLVSLLSYQDTRSQQESSQLVNDTQSVISQAHRLSKLTLELEAIERQFLIIGTETTLEPFQETQNQWSNQLAQLRESVASSPEKLAQLDKIAERTKLWIETVAEPEIALRRTVELPKISLDHIETLILRGKGKEIMDSIRAASAVLEEDFRAADGHGEANTLHTALSAAINMETGERGYLITGEQSFLEPYHQGQKDFQSHMTQLRAQILRSPDWNNVTAIANSLETLQQRWIEEIVDPKMPATRDRSGPRIDSEPTINTTHNGSALKHERSILDNANSELQKLKLIFERAGLIEGQEITSSLAASITGQESALHGYMFAGDQRYQTELSTKTDQFNQYLAELNYLMVRKYDRASVLAQVEQIESLVQQWQQEAAETEILARRQINLSGLTPTEAVQKSFGSNDAKIRLNAIESSLSQLDESFLAIDDSAGQLLIARIEDHVHHHHVNFLRFMVNSSGSDKEALSRTKLAIDNALLDLSLHVNTVQERNKNKNKNKNKNSLTTQIANTSRQINLWHLKLTESGQRTRKIFEEKVESAVKNLQTVVANATGKKILDQFRQKQKKVQESFDRAQNNNAVSLVVRLGKTLVDQETGQRGYLITGQDTFLEPYFQGHLQFKSEIAELTNIAVAAFDPASTKVRITGIEQTIKQWKEAIGDRDFSLKQQVTSGEILASTLREKFSDARSTDEMPEIRQSLKRLLDTFTHAQNRAATLILKELLGSLSNFEASHRGFLLTGDSYYSTRYNQSYADIQSQLSALSNIVEQGYVQSEMLADIEALRLLAEQWRRETGVPEINLRRQLAQRGASMSEIIKLIENGDGKRIINELIRMWNKFIATEEVLVINRANDAKAIANQALISLIISNIIAALFALVAAIYLLKTILQSLGYIESATRQITDGDYSTRIEVLRDDSLGQLSESFNQMADQLSDAHKENEFSKKHLKEQAEILEVAVKESAQANLELIDQKFAMDQHTLISVADIRGTITLANENFSRVSGYSLDELIGANHRILKSTHHDDDFFRDMYLAISKGDVWKSDICNINKEGNEYWVNTTIVPFMKDGKVDRYISIRTDITANKRVESSLVEARLAAESAVKTKSEFLANMSHEIRTPMNGVLGMIGLVVNSDLTNEQTRRLGMARSSAESLLSIINDILDFSKVDAGMLDLEIIPFDIREMLEGLAENMSFKSDEKGLPLILDAGAIQHSMVLGDPGRLRQIITNLLNNAIKFTETGEVVIKARLDDHEDPHFQRFVCSVTDSGIGIPEEKREHIFDAFGQVDSSTTRQFGGTGLGLTIVKQLCTLMDGDIKATEAAGGGSCFEFAVSLLRTKQPVLELPKIDMSSANILVVDHNPINRRVLCEQLQAWNISVEGCESGPEAITLITKHRDQHSSNFDVIFIESNLPGMDGDALGLAISQEPTNSNISLVMMTSSIGAPDQERMEQFGFSQYFTRPASSSDLFDTVSNLLNSNASDEKPLDQPPLETTNSAPESPIKWPNNPHILIAEDNLINQTLLTSFLDDFGLPYSVCDDGQQTLETLLATGYKEEYALILMDCQMPVMDGFCATDEIRGGRAGEQYRSIPIIALTANAMRGDREVCIKAGMNDYLSKPFTPDELFSVLKIWLIDKNAADSKN